MKYGNISKIIIANGSFKTADTNNFVGDGSPVPPVHESHILNKISDRILSRKIVKKDAVCGYKMVTAGGRMLLSCCGARCAPCRRRGYVAHRPRHTLRLRCICHWQRSGSRPPGGRYFSHSGTLHHSTEAFCNRHRSAGSRPRPTNGVPHKLQFAFLPPIISNVPVFCQ